MISKKNITYNHMKKLGKQSSSIPELTWISKEDEEKYRALTELTSHSRRLLSCHQQKTLSTFPPSPYIWRKSTPRDPRNSNHLMRSSNICLVHDLKIPQKDWESCHIRQRRVKFPAPPMPEECVIDLMKWQRLKDLTRSLSSSIEEEQIYAAQALGKLRISKEFIMQALWVMAQIGSERVKYECCRTLVLLGCLDKFVILSLIKHLKGCSLNRRMDTLMGLHMALNAWIMVNKNKREPIGAKDTLIKTLKSLIKGKSALDDVALEAAMCLSFLDHENPIACEFLLQCLTQGDMKRKMKAMTVLVKLMKIYTLPILQGAMDQLRNSLVKKHRLEAIKLIRIFGLEEIQKLGMENEVFELLKLKIHDDPFQEVREAVAEVVEALKMKSMMLNVMESELNDASALVRHQAVVSIGVLGIRNSYIFHFLLDMLDLERNHMVRKALEKLLINLSKKDPWVRAKLEDWKLPEEEEQQLVPQKGKDKSLKLRKMRQEMEHKKKSVLESLSSLISQKVFRKKKVVVKKESSDFDFPIKGIALASDYPPCVKVHDKKEHLKRPWDSPVIRKHLKQLASY
ncbi:protein HEATR9 [Antechinus flavipes]|uniref:protein HEATR9 n=1 Tax=Antechinus flavipes TaxID=38775 RepID=UPI0022368B81|nr:protein HEATR9 [Antechinus flavipes]